MSPQYGELWPTSGWDRSSSLGHSCKFQRVSRLGTVTARQCSSGRQPNFASLNRGRHLYSAGQPSRWALAHISNSELLSQKRIFCGNWSSFMQAYCRSCCTTSSDRALNELKALMWTRENHLLVLSVLAWSVNWLLTEGMTNPVHRLPNAVAQILMLYQSWSHAHISQVTSLLCKVSFIEKPSFRVIVCKWLWFLVQKVTDVFGNNVNCLTFFLKMLPFASCYGRRME